MSHITVTLSGPVRAEHLLTGTELAVMQKKFQVMAKLNETLETSHPVAYLRREGIGR